MTCEDERRFHEATHSHLQSLVQEWIDFRVATTPWWHRPPARKKGAIVDVRDSMGVWNPAVIEDWHTEFRMRPSIAPHAAIHRRNGRYGTARVDTTIMYHVRFLGWTSKWDEFVTCDRISGLGTRTYPSEQLRTRISSVESLLHPWPMGRASRASLRCCVFDKYSSLD